MVAVGKVGSKYLAQVKGGTTDIYRMYNPAYTRNKSLMLAIRKRLKINTKTRSPRDNKASERCRYLASIGESKEDNTNQDFVGQRIQKTANAGGLAWKPK